MAYANTLTALADPTRRRVFERLRSGPASVGDLAAELPVSRPAVSQHLCALVARIVEAGATVNLSRHLLAPAIRPPPRCRGRLTT